MHAQQLSSHLPACLGLAAHSSFKRHNWKAMADVLTSIVNAACMIEWQNKVQMYGICRANGDVGTLCHATLCDVIAGGSGTRLATVAFGAGFGAGSAWQACAKDVSSSWQA